MTTGRINQVTIVRYCISNNHACPKAHTITGNTTNRHCKWMPARWLSWVRRLKKSFNSRHAYGCIQAQKYWVIRTRHDTVTVERELGSGAAMASVCFASHRTLESKTKQPTVQAGKLIKVCARRWVRRTDSVGSSCAGPNSQKRILGAGPAQRRSTMLVSLLSMLRENQYKPSFLTQPSQAGFLHQ